MTIKKEKEIKERAITIRLPNRLYDFYVEKTLQISQKERRLVKISEVLREALEKGKNL